jgi:prepilin-type N-terminal cleavage/methylation domain-containing protein
MKIVRKGQKTGWTLTEMLVVVAVIAILAAIGFPVYTSMQQRAYRERGAEKLRSLGVAFTSFTTENNGNLPWEDAPGSDDWQTVSDPENEEVWYNALPRLMGFEWGSQLAANPHMFYDNSYPLFLPGAPYPKSDKKLGEPYFAIAMNSRLQRKNEEGLKVRGRMANIQVPTQTVIFLERGMPKDKKTNPGQRGFDAGPKANPRAFVARYNGKGMLIFADGHIEVFAVSDLISDSGNIKVPQVDVIWTDDPDDDPN